MVPEASLGRVYAAIADSVRAAVGSVITLAAWMAGGPDLLVAMTDSPRKRPSQRFQAQAFALRANSRAP